MGGASSERHRPAWQIDVPVRAGRFAGLVKWGRAAGSGAVRYRLPVRGVRYGVQGHEKVSGTFSLIFSFVVYIGQNIFIER